MSCGHSYAHPTPHFSFPVQKRIGMEEMVAKVQEAYPAPFKTILSAKEAFFQAKL